MTTLIDSPPPPVDVAEQGGGSDWVPLITAKNDIDAHLLEGLLNEAGIEVRTVKDRSGPAWLMNGSDPWAPVGVFVQRFQYDDSRVVLAEVSYSAPSAPPVAQPQKGWSPVTWWTVAIALALVFTGIGFARSAEYIDRCGFTTTCDDAP
jgi:hypothetical protein